MQNLFLKRTHWYVLTQILIVSFVFVFLRLVNIHESFLFFGDIGRDFYVLQNWGLTGKPPLLGPQTSALPFNQSALYFYILYPFYVILNHSLFATIWASIVYHLSVFVVGAVWLRSRLRLSWVWFSVWLVMAIHPQFVVQQRYVWNPSFVGISLLCAYVFFELLREHFSWTRLAGFAVSIALATAFSYSAVPVLIAFLVLALFTLGRRFVFVPPAVAVALGLVNLPTIAFELRHGFVLSKMMLYGEKLTQTATSLAEKLQSIELYVVAGQLRSWNILIVSVFFGLLASYFFEQYRVARQENAVMRVFGETLRALSLFVLVGVQILLLPVSLHAHYIFGIVVTAAILMATLPRRYTVVGLLVVSVVWLRPQQLVEYYRPAFRTATQSLQCAQQVCAQVREPVFVSVQAGYHVYHNGFEFKYLLKEAGCTVLDVETQAPLARHMVVFADAGTYEHGRTDYNELTQFGASQETSSIACDGQMRAHILERVE